MGPDVVCYNLLIFFYQGIDYKTSKGLISFGKSLESCRDQEMKRCYFLF